MKRSLHPTGVSIVLVLAAAAAAPTAAAQTAAVNPQRPARTVETVRPLDKVQRDAARLDELWLRGLQQQRVEPNPIVDDATFARRAYLKILGRIPTLAETETFLADQSPGKRAALCDRLLDSPGHTSHFVNFWFDLLRVQSRQRQLSGEPFAHYLREAVRTDMPYDQMVREMLVAAGPAHEEGHGATGMLLRDMNMPHDAMANTVRLFLGTRIECAQCHNHPFDIWTQKQFFAMAAFFGGLAYRDPGAMPNLRDLRGELANVDQATRNRVLQLARRMTQGLSGSGTGVEKLPADYKYDDAEPRSPVLASTIFGADVKLRYPRPTRAGRGARNQPQPAVDSRDAFAAWMTDRKNPQFAKVIANRMWARTFGAGLVEPLDDWKKDTKTDYAELSKQLEKLMLDLDFDLRQFERVLVNTQLFQREVEADAPTPGHAPRFAGPVLRRMTAQQMWDSLLTLVFDDVDDRLRATDERARPVYEQFASVKTADSKALLAMVEDGRDPARMMAQQRREELRQELAQDAELQRRARPLLLKLNQARRDGDQQAVLAIAEELERMGLPLGRRAGRGREGDLLRASELDQPAPPGHLLRQFGQSDRETIDASSDAATVPQVLTLLNGFLDQRVLEGQSALRRDLETAEDGARRVRIAFLTTLNREPTPGELDDWRRQIAIHGGNVIKDLVWVLCNSNEFRFVQ